MTRVLHLPQKLGTELKLYELNMFDLMGVLENRFKL